MNRGPRQYYANYAMVVCLIFILLYFGWYKGFGSISDMLLVVLMVASFSYSLILEAIKIRKENIYKQKEIKSADLVQFIESLLEKAHQESNEHPNESTTVEQLQLWLKSSLRKWVEKRDKKSG